MAIDQWDVAVPDVEVKVEIESRGVDNTLGDKTFDEGNRNGQHCSW